jgi:hypothetical protein
LPAIASSTSASVGWGTASRSTCADMIWPGMQKPHWTAVVEERRLDGTKAILGRRVPRSSSIRRRRPRPRTWRQDRPYARPRSRCRHRTRRRGSTPWPRSASCRLAGHRAGCDGARPRASGCARSPTG